ncbi:MAG: peroxiredoxin [Thermoplasmataceae archaeon]|jgi:peroxiredoxin Q/BCP
MTGLLNVGDTAPDFESINEEGKSVSLKEFRGKPVVLYFYPKDDTPGCTAEACSFRDNFEEFQKKGVVVLGVSIDSPKSHKNFKDKYNLNFPLISDKSREIVEMYGATSDSKSAKRVTFIIDRNGKIAYVYSKVTPKDHSVEVMKKLQELKLVS